MVPISHLHNYRNLVFLINSWEFSEMHTCQGPCSQVQPAYLRCFHSNPRHIYQHSTPTSTSTPSLSPLELDAFHWNINLGTCSLVYGECSFCVTLNLSESLWQDHLDPELLRQHVSFFSHTQPLSPRGTNTQPECCVKISPCQMMKAVVAFQHTDPIIKPGLDFILC